MTTTIQRIAVILISISMVACTSIQPLPVGNAPGTSLSQRQGHSVSIGDTVTIKPKRGAAFKLVVTEVNSELIAGTHDGKVMQVMFSDIESIEKRRFNILRTALIVLGIIAVGQYASGVSKISNP
jgi:hypothetical protein